MVPGQRLAETELAARYGVGRNAVRETMQHLAVRGVIDLSPSRSPAIRLLDLDEAMEVLDVAEAMLCLAARTAANRYDKTIHRNLLADAMHNLEQAFAVNDPPPCNRARRHFYRALLEIGGNRELQRLFPAIGMHIVHVQYSSPALQQYRRKDYCVIANAVVAGNAEPAAAAVSMHVENARSVIRSIGRGGASGIYRAPRAGVRIHKSLYSSLSHSGR